MAGSARVRFARWTEWSTLSDAEIARRLKCDGSLPAKLRSGVRQPGLRVAHGIEQLTGQPRPDGERWDESPVEMLEWIAGSARSTRPRKRAA